MTVQEMKERKREYGLTNEMLAELSDVPLSTVQKIFSGATVSPRKTTIDALERVLGDRRVIDELYGKLPPRPEWRRAPGYDQDRAAPASLREEAVLYGDDRKKTRPAENYTLEDYYALPEDRRAELIDGVFYEMTAPSPIHQIILSELYLLFRECSDAHPEQNCQVLFAPCDVRLDLDDRTMVQPDLLVLCDQRQMTPQRIEGAPDLAAEVLSASTRKKDLFLKLYKYQHAGVREYWIVDPRDRKVLVYVFDGEDDHPKSYGFEDRIPIAISDGRCVIDFSRVNTRLLPLTELFGNKRNEY